MIWMFIYSTEMIRAPELVTFGLLFHKENHMTWANANDAKIEEVGGTVTNEQVP